MKRARDPKSAYIPTTLAILGEVYLRAARYPDAVSALTEAETLNPAARGYLLPAIRAALGTALLESGKPDEAAPKLQAALSSEGVTGAATPAQAEAHLGLARVLQSRGDHEAALQHLAAADEFWHVFDPVNPERRKVAAWRAELVRGSSASRTAGEIRRHANRATVQ